MFQTTLPLEDNSKNATSVGLTTNGHSDGIFGWYRYIQDFTGEFALEWLGRIAQSGDLVWEPFSGSGTTLVAAKLLGYESIGHDISPFMVDVARTKVDWTVCPSNIREALNDVLDRLSERLSTEPPAGVRVTWDEYDEQVHSVTLNYPDDPKMRKWIAPRVVNRVGALLSAAGPETARVIFTSPPYPNDMEYVHQTRLELALLGYIENARGLTSLKKQMISSSVKLVYRSNEWQKEYGLEIGGVREVYAPIAKTLEGRNWGWNAADMTAQYFGGMRAVLRNWSTRLVPGGIAAVVIGDSAFNGVKVPSDILLAEAAQMEALALEDIEVFRNRWNTKHNIELRESVVLLRKQRRGSSTI